MGGQLVDRFGRVHDYLRISVTDRCNLRCVYCMPENGMEFEPDDRLLTFEEIAAVVRALAAVGVRKLRITGGEPLVRKNLERLVSMVSAVPGIEDVALTTNGIFLAPRAQALAEAGLKRVNISLDSLKPDRFAAITRGGDIRKVLASVEECFRVGLKPVKLNVVLMRGVNDEEIESFLRLTLERDVAVRFIEYMPIGHEDDGWRTKYMPLAEIWARCERMGWKTERVGSVYGNGPGEYFRIRGAVGTFGLIHPVSDHFCGACNRLRLTADGYVKPCLYWTDEFNVRDCIGDERALQNLFMRALAAKPQNHEMALALHNGRRSHTPTARRMSQIGG